MVCFFLRNTTRFGKKKKKRCQRRNPRSRKHRTSSGKAGTQLASPGQVAPLVLSLTRRSGLERAASGARSGQRCVWPRTRLRAQSVVPGGRGGRVQREELGPSLVLPPGQRQGPRSRVQLAPRPPPAVPRGGGTPCRVGPTRGGGRALGNVVTAPQISKRPRRFGARRCLQTVCACVCLPT